MGDRSAIGVLRDIHQGKVEHTTMPPVFISWKSPAEERAVGDGAFCFLGRRNRSSPYQSSYFVPMGSCVAAGIDDERRAA